MTWLEQARSLLADLSEPVPGLEQVVLTTDTGLLVEGRGEQLASLAARLPRAAQQGGLRLGAPASKQLEYSLVVGPQRCELTARVGDDLLLGLRCAPCPPVTPLLAEVERLCAALVAAA